MRRDRVGRHGRAAARRPSPAGSAADVAAPPGSHRSADLAAGIAIALFAAVLAFIVLGPHRIGAFDVESDFYGAYAPAALSIQHGHILPAGGKLPAVYGFVGPLYPALLALAGSALGDLFGAAELISLLAGVAAVTLWFLLLRRRAGAGLALVVVLLLVTHPLLLRYGYSATTDAAALALQSAALFVLFTRRGTPAAAAAGLFAGLAVLTRYTSVFLVPAGCVAIAMGATAHPRRGRAVAAYVLGTLALIAPWLVYGRMHGAEVQFHQLLAYDVYGNARGVSWDDFLANVWPRFEHSPLAVLTADPGAVAGRMLFNVGDHLRLDATRLLGWPVAALAVLAPLLAFRDRRWRQVAPLAAPGAWAFLVLLPAAHDERYSLVVLPFYALLAGATLTSGACMVLKGRGAVLARAAVVGAVVAVSAVAAVREQARVLEQQPLEVLACADTLRHLARPDDFVIARKPNLAFHARVGFAYFPPVDGLVELGRYARERRARWLFISPIELQLRPATAFMLDTLAAIPGLTLRAYAAVPIVVDGLPWKRVAALYEIGPRFGDTPAWFANDTLRTLHSLRGWAVTVPDARTCFRLAGLELLTRNLAGARAAWRESARIDPQGMAVVLGRFHGDTLTAVRLGQSQVE